MKRICNSFQLMALDVKRLRPWNNRITDDIIARRSPHGPEYYDNKSQYCDKANLHAPIADL
jgi:hypothetical protein